jgi:hypothetical protein
MLFSGSNRYGNAHLLSVDNSRQVLVEESEFYRYHRDGLLSFNTTDSEYRRNYFNSRRHADLAGGYRSIYRGTGDDAIAIYPGVRNLVENNITENTGAGYTIEANGPATSNR